MHNNETTEIAVLGQRVRLKHPPGGFRTSLDSVMVAAACPARAGQRVLDLGCGVGGAGLCLLARVAGVNLTGVDFQADLIDLARLNAPLNGQPGAVFIASDIAAFLSADTEYAFDHVLCNPPFLEAGTYQPSPDQSRAAALGHDGQDYTLEEWLRLAHRFLKSRGVLTLIHRADHIDDIIHGLGKRFGGIEMIPLWPHAGEAAKRVIIRAIKDHKGPAVFHAGLVLHDQTGAYTEAANRILKDGAALTDAG